MVCLTKSLPISLQCSFCLFSVCFLIKIRSFKQNRNWEEMYIYNQKESAEISGMCNEERWPREFNTHRINCSQEQWGWKQFTTYLLSLCEWMVGRTWTREMLMGQELIRMTKDKRRQIYWPHKRTIKLWYMKMTVILITVGVLGTVPKILRKNDRRNWK